MQYAGSSGDYNPLHTGEIFTTKVAGYPSVFAHGMLSMGATGKLLTDYVGDGMLTYCGVRFTYQVWPDTLTATATVTGIREEDGVDLVDLDVSTQNQRTASRSSRARRRPASSPGQAVHANFPRWRPHARREASRTTRRNSWRDSARVWVTYSVAS